VFGTQGPEVRILSLRPVVHRALAAGYLSEMRTGRKPGSVVAYRALTTALAVPTEDLVGFGSVSGRSPRSGNFREAGRLRARKRRVPVPINDTLHAALAEARAAATTEYVIEWAGGPVARIKQAFRDAAARAKLAGVTPHVLRHTAVTWTLLGGIDPWKAACLVGMTVEMVQQVYGHHPPDYLRDAARALG